MIHWYYIAFFSIHWKFPNPNALKHFPEILSLNAFLYLLKKNFNKVINMANLPGWWQSHTGKGNSRSFHTGFYTHDIDYGSWRCVINVLKMKCIVLMHSDSVTDICLLKLSNSLDHVELCWNKGNKEGRTGWTGGCFCHGWIKRMELKNVNN